MFTRIERRHHPSRRCIPLSEPALFQAMVAVQRAVRCYTRTPEEVCCIGLILVLSVQDFLSICDKYCRVLYGVDTQRHAVDTSRHVFGAIGTSGYRTEQRGERVGLWN